MLLYIHGEPNVGFAQGSGIQQRVWDMDNVLFSASIAVMKQNLGRKELIFFFFFWLTLPHT